jgi:hypothetical protein
VNIIVSFVVDSVILVGQQGDRESPEPVARLSHRPDLIYCEFHHRGKLLTTK